jgi:hypothetical protein
LGSDQSLSHFSSEMYQMPSNTECRERAHRVVHALGTQRDNKNMQCG